MFLPSGPVLNTAEPLSNLYLSNNTKSIYGPSKWLLNLDLKNKDFHGNFSFLVSGKRSHYNGYNRKCSTRGLISGNSKRFSSSPKLPKRVWGKPNSYSVGTEGSIPPKVRLTTFFHLVLSFRMSGAKPHSPYVPSRYI